MARITRVQVRVNGAETASEHELTANPLHPTAIPLPTAEPVRTLEILVTGVDRGESAYARVGFAELSLELRAAVREE